MREFYGKMVELLDEHGTLALVTVVEVRGSTPREGGAKMMVLPDGTIHGTIGGGPLERMVAEEAQKAMEEGSGFYREYDLVGEDEGGIGAMCGGSCKVLVEVIGAPERLVICGGGHIGLEVARMGLALGMRVWVVDPREEFSEPSRFPPEVRVLRSEPSSDEVVDLVTPGTFVVIMTHDHDLDLEALRRLAPLEYGYLGMIGSRRKVRKMMDILEKEGMGPEVLERVHAPIGLDIGAETPPEIGVSILSEIIAIKRKGETPSMSMKTISGER